MAVFDTPDGVPIGPSGDSQPLATAIAWTAGAATVVTRGQRRALGCIAAVLIVGFFLAPRYATVSVILLLTGVYITTASYRLWLAWRGLQAGSSSSPVPAPPRIADADLPDYSILVPLYRETAVLPTLTAALGALDYPKDKLDIQILLEEDDFETIAAVLAAELPATMRASIVPQGRPKSKPRACNFGLVHARGDLTVIFDAEDVPEPDQLRKVAAAFALGDPSLGCIQGKLNYYNRDQNLLTRWFASEYAMQFDLYLPGLHATGAPIPLGGTSNHFPTTLLRQLGGWDAFNVAEDADLGIRLARAGFHTSVVDSTTWEEATSRPGNWTRQRSRWIKGYAQTWLVHMRRPRQLYRELGPVGFWSFQATVGGTVFILLVNPLFWALSLTLVLTRSTAIEDLFPAPVYVAGSLCFFLGNFAFSYATLLGTLHRGYYGFARLALVVAPYWAFMSLAAWKGVLQLVTKPFYWEKTTHGHAGGTIRIPVEEASGGD